MSESFAFLRVLCVRTSTFRQAFWRAESAKMRFDGLPVCGIIGSVSFRPLIPNFWRAALTGMACLAFVGVIRAGEGARNIEVVPFHNTLTDTNLEKPVQDDSESFKVWKPLAPNSITPSTPANRMLPLPRSTQQTLSKEEQQMLDRRRNWVFMTPEDYATTDPKTGKNYFGSNSDKEDNMTAMERYYHRLEQSSKSSYTNEFSQFNQDRLSAPTNYVDTPGRNTDQGLFGQTPFDARPQADVFQPLTSEKNLAVFGGDAATAQTPEEIRAQQEQKAHMDTFKQLWNIDQASTAATPVSTPASAPVDSAPLFGVSTPGVSSPSQAIVPTAAGNPVKPVTPAGMPVTAPRYTAPEHSSFTPVQRPF